MLTSVPATQRCCYLAEWYRPDLGQVSVDEIERQLGDLDGMKLLRLVAVPADDVLYGVFDAEANSAATITAACGAAGFAVQRLTYGVDTRLCGALAQSH